MSTLASVLTRAADTAPDAVALVVPPRRLELVPGAEVAEVELIDHGRGSLAHFKVPRHVRFVAPGEWPMSATKVSKAALRERIAADLLSLGALS